MAHSGFGPFDGYWADEVYEPRRIRRGWGRWAGLGLAAGAALLGVAVLSSAPPVAPRPAPAPAVAPPSSEIVDPTLAPLFSFQTAEGARARYEARTDRATGARRDAYSLGALDGEAAALRVETWKSAGGGAAGLFVEIAETAAASGAAVERLGVSQFLASSQGPVEWAELTLAGGRGRRACVGFRRLARADGGLRGVACAAVGGKMDAAALSCLLDRLAITRAGREAGFADIVKNAVGRRAACRAAIG